MTRMVNARVRRCICMLLLGVMMMMVKIEGSVVNLTYLESAVSKGAVCLDGSPPAYQFDKGVGEGANNWLLHIQGGGWCYSVQTCQQRATSELGSSKLMGRNNFTGILSSNNELNPHFYNWNRVLVRYCDGSSFTGDVEKVDPVSKLYFRGARIFDAILEDLLTKGLKNASNALLSGCSAGGLSSIMHCEKFRALIPTSATRVKCLSDGGYFLHTKDASGRYQFEERFRSIVNLHCFYPQYVAPEIRTPLFLVNSAYDLYQVSMILAAGLTNPGGPWVECQFDIQNCTASQIKTLLGFKSKFIITVLAGLPNHLSRGMFINTCHTHCQTQYQPKWSGDPTATLHGTSVSDAVGDWFYDRSRFQEIDEEHGLPRWQGVYCEQR
ncbi:hypothetical protein LguiA_007177 [Lonicera macranthoides]